jgi:glutathione peroxidase-family protein
MMCAAEHSQSRRAFSRAAVAAFGAGVLSQAAIADDEAATAPAAAVSEEEVLAEAAVLETPIVAAPAAAAPSAAASAKSALDFELLYNGKPVPMSKLLGPKATLIINGKLDDPIAMQQMPDITAAAGKYGREGLHVLIVPTDQGYFEADEDRVVKIKFYQFHGFGQYPVAAVLDKTDIVGNTAHPLYKYMCRTLKNPNGIGRVTLNYEKFLLDAEGKPLRRYPRKLALGDVDADIAAAVRGQPLPPPNRAYTVAWLKAKAEAEKSEYAFKLGLNYYNNNENVVWDK